MRARLSWVLALIAVSIGWSVPAMAQTQAEPFTLEVEAGIDSWVPSRGSVIIDVTIESDVLVTGSLQVNYLDARTEVPVDVPAGGVKTYPVTLTSATHNGLVTVQLADADGRRLTGEALRLQVALDEMVVGVLDDRLTAQIDAAQTSIGGQPLVSALVPADATVRDLQALGYVVGERPVDPVWEWVSQGGRLVTTVASLEEAPFPLEPLGSLPGSDLAWYRAGSGEIAAADTLTSGIDWATAIRPVPLRPAAQDQWSSIEAQMTRAATNSGDGALAELPWLPFAMIGYLVAVGPLNLWILRRLGRREWAWVTIPLVSVVAVGVFWASGRQRLDSTTLRHASVTVVGDEGYRRSTVVVAAGRQDTYEVSVESAEEYAVGEIASVFGGGPGGPVVGVLSGGGVSWELPELGVGVMVAAGPPQQEISVTRMAGIDPTYEVTNGTDTTLQHWALVVGGTFAVGPGRIEPGQTAVVAVAGANEGGMGGGMDVGSLLVERSGLWNDNGYETIAPIASAAAAELGPGRGFVVAVSDDAMIDATVNGEERRIEGVAAWVAPIPSGVAGQTDVVGAQMVGLGDWRSVDIGQGGWIDTDAVTMSFTTATQPSQLTLRPLRDWGRPAEPVEVWNWRTGAFEEAAVGVPIASGDFISAAGETIVRVSARGQDGEPLFPSSLWLEYQP